MKRAFAQIKYHPSRFVALLLAIIISVGFVTISLVFTETESKSIAKQISAPSSRADVVVGYEQMSQEPPSNSAVISKIKTVPGVAEAVPVVSAYGTAGNVSVEVYGTVPADLQWGSLSAGNWPTNTNEVVLSESLAADQNKAVGDSITLSMYGNQGPVEKTLTVSGISTEVRSLLSGVALQAFVDPGALTDVAAGASMGLWLIKAAPGVSVDQLVPDVQTAINGFGGGITAYTQPDYAQAQAQMLTSGVDVFRFILLTFGAIAMVVGMLIISNTFTILIAQRRRQIGLTRAVGATISQVQKEMIAEALILGAIGSGLGIAAGIGLSAIGAAFTGSIMSGIAIPLEVVWVFVAGVVVTLLAAWLPTLRTAAIKPLEALRAASTDAAKQRPGLGITIPVVIAAVIGLAMIILAIVIKGGVTETNPAGGRIIGFTIGGSVFLALALLFGCGWYVPPVVRLMGAIPRRTGATARLAVANAVRNPKRTSATCLALMLAVGLIATLQVGSASVKASAEGSIENQYPVEVTVNKWDGPLPEGLVDKVRAVQGITAAVEVQQVYLFDNEKVPQLIGVGSDITEVAPNFKVGADEILTSPNMAKVFGWTDGQQVTISTTEPQASATLKVRIVDGADVGPIVTKEVAAKFVPPNTGNDPAGASQTVVWATSDTRDGEAARTMLEDIQGLSTGLAIDGSLVFTTILTQVLDIMLLVATALLGAAVLIALIGVGNTIGLSVLERTRESALLRALGLKRSQLRATLAIEAVLIALAGALVGVVLGIAFGYLGTWAMMSELGEPALLRVSGWQLAADAGVAIVAGLLASVLPARRAVKAAPTEALAEV